MGAAAPMPRSMPAAVWRGRGHFGQGHGEHFDQNTIDVVFGLLLGQSQRIDLHTITKTAVFWVCDAVAGFANLVPEIDKGAHFAHFGDKVDASVDEERYPPDKA